MKLINKLSSVLLFATTAITMSAASAAPINVAVLSGAGGTGSWWAATNGSWGAVADQLNDDTYFDFTATLLKGASVTSASALAGYDVVLMGGSGWSETEYTTATLAAVSSFLKSGHGVVSTSWSRYGGISTSRQSRLDADFINPVVVDGQSDYTASAIQISATPHAITAGITDFATNSKVELGVLDANAKSLATANRLNAIAYQDTVGRSVYLGLLYTADQNYGITSLRTGNADRLLEQAVAWAGTTHTDVPEPTSIALIGLGLASLGVSRRRRFS